MGTAPSSTSSPRTSAPTKQERFANVSLAVGGCDFTLLDRLQAELYDDVLGQAQV